MLQERLWAVVSAHRLSGRRTGVHAAAPGSRCKSACISQEFSDVSGVSANAWVDSHSLKVIVNQS